MIGSTVGRGIKQKKANDDRNVYSECVYQGRDKQ